MDILEISVKVAIIYIPFLFALCFHEVAHGWVAKRLGDNTASLMGRLTLNPAAHADPLGTYVLPIAGIVMGVGFFGWAKPVPVNERNLKHPKRDMFLISAAGPASNVLLAVIAAFVLVLASRSGVEPGNRAFMSEFAQSFVLTNMMLAIFNLIPVPPLDGAKVLAPFLPDSVNDTLEANQAMISMILLFVLLSGIVSLWPIIKFSSEVLIGSVMWVL